MSPNKETYRHGRILIVDCVVRVFAKRDKDHGLVIVATNQLQTLDAMTIYAKRWEIESLFVCLKGRGFNLEETHLTKMDRVSVSGSQCFSCLLGFIASVFIDKQRPLKNVSPSQTVAPQASLFALGFGFVDWGLAFGVIEQW